MTHWDKDRNPLYELFSIMFLKSDAEKALIEEVYEKLIQHGETLTSLNSSRKNTSSFQSQVF